MGKRFTEVVPIIYDDIYNIRQYDNIDYIIDIGANIGTFSLYASVLFPNAKVFAYEPCDANRAYLKSNLYGFKNVSIREEALGDGSELYFRKVGGEISTAHMFVKDSEDGYAVQTKTLRQIFKENKIDLSKKIVLKMDCEGGERFLINGEYDDIIKSCFHFSLEVHFPNPGKTQFHDMPEWEEYRNWIATLGDVHNIKYGHSNKNIGIGMYELSKKKGV